MDEKIKGYLEFGKDIEISKKKVFNGIFVFFFISGITIAAMVLTEISIVAICLQFIGTVISITLVYLMIRLIKSKSKDSFCLGLHCIIFSCAFLEMAVVFLPLHLQMIPVILCIVISPSFILLINKWIKDGLYCKQKSNYSKNVIISSIGALVGLGIGPIFFSTLDNESIVIIIAMAGLLMAKIFMAGGLASFYKYYLIKKYNYKFE